MFSFLLDIFNPKIKKYSKILEILFSFLFIAFMAIIYYLGIKKIGNAIFHVYSIFNIILGYITYNLLIKLIANNNKK